MIANSQNMGLAAFAGSACVGHPAMPDPALPDSGMVFMLALSDGDPAFGIDVGIPAPADATSARDPLNDDSSEMVAEHPLMAIAFVAPNTHQHVAADLPSVQTRYAAPHSSKDGVSQPARNLLAAQPGDTDFETPVAMTDQSVATNSDRAKKAEANIPSMAEVASCGQDAGTKSTFATAALPSHAPTVELVVPSSGEQDRLAVTSAALQSASPRNVKASTVPAAQAGLPTDPSPLPHCDDAIVGDTRRSIAETLWRAQWGGAEPAAGRIVGIGAEAQIQTPNGEGLSPSAPPKARGDMAFAATSGISPVNSAPTEAPLPSAAATAKSAASAAPGLDAKPAFATFEGAPDAALLDAAAFPLATGSLSPSASPVAVVLSPASAQLPTAFHALAPAIVEMTKTGNDGPTELALAPEELGRLTISLQQEGDFVRVSMMAERPETLDLLRRHAGDLLADLRQSGFSGASFSFGQSGQDQAQRFAGRTFDADHAASAPTTPLDFKQSTLGRPHQGTGLDLRF